MLNEQFVSQQVQNFSAGMGQPNVFAKANNFQDKLNSVAINRRSLDVIGSREDPRITHALGRSSASLQSMGDLEAFEKAFGGPAISDLHIDRYLSNLSIALIQSPDAFTGTYFGQPMRSKVQTNIISSWDRESFIRDEAKLRAPGAEPSLGKLNKGPDVPFNCQEYAFAEDVPDEQFKNIDDGIQFREALNQYITHKVLLKLDILTALKLFIVGIWGTDIDQTDPGFTQWDAVGSTPFQDVTTASNTIHAVTGRNANSALMGREVFNGIQHNAEMIERIRYVKAGVLTEDLIASLWGIAKMKVAQAIKATNAEGAAATTQSYIFGKSILVAYQHPTMTGGLLPSAWTTIFWNKFGRQIVTRVMRRELVRATRYETSTNYDAVVTAPELGHFRVNLVS